MEILKSEHIGNINGNGNILKASLLPENYEKGNLFKNHMRQKRPFILEAFLFISECYWLQKCEMSSSPKGSWR